MGKTLQQGYRCKQMKKPTIILSALFLIQLTASASLALDMEYYTYGGFNPITQAFTKIALIFSDTGYQGLLFVIMVLGLLAGVTAWLARAATGARVIPWYGQYRWYSGLCSIWPFLCPKEILLSTIRS